MCVRTTAPEREREKERKREREKQKERERERVRVRKTLLAKSDLPKVMCDASIGNVYDY